MSKHAANGHENSETKNLADQVAQLVAALSRQPNVTPAAVEESDLQRLKRLNRERQQRFRDKKKPHGALVRISQDDYSGRKRGREMPASKSKSRSNGRNGKAVETTEGLTRFSRPTGDSVVERIARGLTKWRESQHLTIPKMAEEYHLPQQTLYRIERAKFPGTTITKIDLICRTIGMDIIDILQLGA